MYCMPHDDRNSKIVLGYLKIKNPLYPQSWNNKERDGGGGGVGGRKKISIHKQ